jgi:hypothetical protein
LASHIEGVKDTKSYFKLKLEKESELYFLARFEGVVEKKEILKNSINNYKTLVDLGTDRFQLSLVTAWLAMLTAPLDCKLQKKDFIFLYFQQHDKHFF